MKNYLRSRTKKLTTLAMLIALAFLVGATFRIRGVFSVAPFLTYDPKDVVILMGGFLFGPLSALAMSIILALLEMVTTSVSGPYGALMNAIASASFTCTAAYVYSKIRNINGAIIGLALGCIVGTCVMVWWNFAIIPLYVPHATRESAQAIMLPAIIPFNLIKYSLNSVMAILVYKKVSAALKAAGLYKEALSQNQETSSRSKHLAVMITSIVIAVALIVLLFLIRGMG